MTSFRSPTPPTAVRRVPRGPVLVIAPHPDDESVGPGATLALHAAQGDAIHALFVFSGIQGDPDGWYNRADLPALREAEARAAAVVLGIGRLTFLGYPDNLGEADYHIFGGLPDDPDGQRRALVAGLASLLAERVADGQPATIYYPWRGEINPDHWGVGEAVELLRTTRPDLAVGRSWMGYEVWTAAPAETVVDVSDTMARKLEAIRAYTSQILYRDYEPIARGLGAYRSLLLETGATFGEAFTGHFEGGT